jgi:hypothetical protein
VGSAIRHRIGPDPEVGERRDHGVTAEAGILLVGHQREHGPDRGARRDQPFGDGDQRGDAALHVRGAATVQAVVLHPRGEGLGHAGHPDGVEVPVEHDGR